MTTPDGGFEEYERLQRLDDQHGQMYWTGRAEGGPIDGGGIRIDAVPSLGMRGLHVNICVGDEPETSAWHVYAFGQRTEPGGAIVGLFKHMGALDGDPATPAD